MATAILKEIFELQIVRTRDKKLLEQQEIIYDVGNGEFDHHDMKKEYRFNGVPYAACGLIWRRYGKEVVLARDSSLNEQEVQSVFRYIDSALIQGIDAADNGIRTCEVKAVPDTSVSNIISGFNPAWDSNIAEDDAFNKAVDFASVVLENALDRQISIIKAREIVISAYNKRERPEILVLDKPYPYMSTLYEIDKDGEVLFVVFPRDEQYIIQTVRNNNGIRGDRKSLPASWAGKRDGELSAIIGVRDAIFCHPQRFIAGAESFESIMKMADIAVGTCKRTEKQSWLVTLKRLLLEKRIVIRRH